MEIKHSSPADLPRLMEIYAIARRFMAEHGNPDQWGRDNWPPESMIRKDIEDGNSYICLHDGKIVGTFYYNYGIKADPCYNKIYDGAWIGGDEYGVIHRIATDGTVKGTGSFCVNWAFEKCGHLRIDTHKDNVVMQNMLKKNGFRHTGSILLEARDDARREAFERIC